MTIPTPIGSIPAVPANAPIADPSVAGAFAGIVGQLSNWTQRVAALLNNLSLVLFLIPNTAPATPSTGWMIYVDSADGKLKAKASTGTVVILGVP